MFLANIQLEVVRYLIRAAADIEAKDHFQNTPLNDAVRSRFHGKIVKIT